MQLEASLLMKLHVTLGEVQFVGGTPGRELCIIPITGGRFEGPLLRGQICSGGADWNTRISTTRSHVFAKYWIKTDDGVMISVQNEGVIDDSADARIKTVPRFEVSSQSPYAFLNSGVYVGELTVGSEPNSVHITLYQLA